VIPFANPFDNYYYSKNYDMKYGRFMGHVSRDALLAALVPNITKYAKNPLMYAIGNKTMRTAKYTRLGLEGLSEIEKGREIVDKLGWVHALRPEWGAYGTTIWTGLNPTANLAGIAVLDAADIYTEHKKSTEPTCRIENTPPDPDGQCNEVESEIADDAQCIEID